MIAGGVIVAQSASAATSAADGFASLAGGTTGGAGGSTVTVNSLAALKTAAKAAGKSTIKINGMITLTGQVDVTSDKTVVGVGANSGLSGGGLRVKGANNVIIQNLKISKAKGTDAITIQKSTHIWVDHNDLSSDLSHGKDFYDGLVDITHAGDLVTVSWIHDHFKASLVGHSDSNASEDTGKLRVTYHHNYFLNTNSRGPSLRFGTGHAFNNLYENSDTAVHSRENAQFLVQNNVFKNVKTPIETTKDSKIDGFVNQSGNDFGGGVNLITRTGSFTQAPYAVSLDPTSSVASKVASGAGTGKVG